MTISNKTFFALCISLSSSLALPAQDVQVVSATPTHAAVLLTRKAHALKELAKIEFTKKDIHRRFLIVTKEDDINGTSVTNLQLDPSDEGCLRWENDNYLIYGSLGVTGSSGVNTFDVWVKTDGSKGASGTWQHFGTARYHRNRGEKVMTLSNITFAVDSMLIL